MDAAARGELVAVTYKPARIRAYRQPDRAQVERLWIDINRELAPEAMRDAFEHYIATALLDELQNALTVFSPSKRNGLWVVEIDGPIVGCFGLEAQGPDVTELRRMYLRADHRGGGVAQQMLAFAEEQARASGFARMILSTAAIQKQAVRFYAKSGYRLLRSETAQAMSTKTVGNGLLRHYFEKRL
jgi:GNAT superfamily N-acetyltransferase